MIIFFFKSVQIFMKDLECAETNEKSIFQFLFFELWLIVFTIYGDIMGFLSMSPTKKKSFKSG